MQAEKVNRRRKKKSEKEIQASSRGAVNFAFTATCGRKFCIWCTAISRKVVGKNMHEPN